MYTTMDENIRKMKDVGTGLFEYIEKNCSADTVAPAELSEGEKLMYLYFGLVGKDLFYDVHTKIRVPDQIKDNPDLETIWKTSAKQMYLQQVLSKAKEIVYRIKEELKVSNSANLEFDPFKCTDTEIAATLLLAKLEGCDVNWNELDHSYCDIHNDWKCTFHRDENYDFDKLLNSTLRSCIDIKHLNKEKVSKAMESDTAVLEDFRNVSVSL